MRTTVSGDHHHILRRERPWRPSDPLPSADYGFGYEREEITEEMAMTYGMTREEAEATARAAVQAGYPDVLVAADNWPEDSAHPRYCVNVQWAGDVGGYTTRVPYTSQDWIDAERSFHADDAWHAAYDAKRAREEATTVTEQAAKAGRERTFWEAGMTTNPDPHAEIAQLRRRVEAAEAQLRLRMDSAECAHQAYERACMERDTARTEAERLRTMIDEHVGPDVRFVAFEQLGKLAHECARWRDLYRELRVISDALQHENTAMREIMRQFAHADYTVHGFGDFCGVCKHDGENVHYPTCLVEQARAFLTSHA